MRGGAGGLVLYKGHGLGNDYLAVDGDALGEPSAALARILCDRHLGVGSDGLLVRVPSEEADFGLRIFNPDGSEAEKSGNGLRIFAAFLRWCGLLEGRVRFTVETGGGVVSMRFHASEPGGPLDVEVEMGKAVFRAAAVGLSGPDRDTHRESISLDSGETLEVTAVSTGNPHAVVFGHPLDDARLREIGGALSAHPDFARGVNVQLVRAAGDREIEIRIWERGVGPTLASGSSSCATAAAAVRRGLLPHGPVTVRMPGGTLQVRVEEDWTLHLRGPVEEVFVGQAAPALLRRLGEERG